MKPILSVIELTTLDNIKFRINFDGQIQTEYKDGKLAALPRINEIYQVTGDFIPSTVTQVVNHDVICARFQNLYGAEYLLTIRRACKWNKSTGRNVYSIETTLSEKREWVAVGQSFTYK